MALRHCKIAKKVYFCTQKKQTINNNLKYYSYEEMEMCRMWLYSRR